MLIAECTAIAVEQWNPEYFELINPFCWLKGDALLGDHRQYLTGKIPPIPFSDEPIIAFHSSGDVLVLFDPRRR